MSLTIRHPALAAAIRSRPDLRAALAEDAPLVYHVSELDQFLLALAAEWPGRELAERLTARLLPSRQELLEQARAKAAATEALAAGTMPEDLFEVGRRLASEREDLIAGGANPADLAVPLAPTDPPKEP